MNVAVASCDASSRAMMRARCFCGLPSIEVNPSTELMQRRGCALTLSPPSVEHDGNHTWRTLAISGKASFLNSPFLQVPRDGVQLDAIPEGHIVRMGSTVRVR